MSCIVGLAHEGHVYIGGDSGGFVNGTILLHDNGKVFRHGDFIFGCSGNRRFGELVRFAFSPPELSRDAELARYMATEFAVALRKSLREHGYLRVKEGRECMQDGDAMLVGVRGQLFYVSDVFSTSSMLDGQFASGSGMDYALGALYASRDRLPEDRIRLALEAAERWNDSVVSPFHIESI